MLRFNHITFLLLIFAGCFWSAGCNARFKGSQGTVQTDGYSIEQSYRVDQDLDRKYDGQTLKYHSNEASLRRSEYERDFYESHYRRVHQNDPADKPARDGNKNNPFME